MRLASTVCNLHTYVYTMFLYSVAFPSCLQYQADYGDLIKTTITQCLRRSISDKSYEWSHVVVDALKSEYEELKDESGKVDSSSVQWGDLKVHTYIFNAYILCQ